MTDNIFEQTPATTEQAQPAAPTLSIPQEALELVGEGKKYKTPEEALRALPHAQAHIARLEQEAKELREQAASARAIEELYETLNARAQAGGEQTAAVPVVDESLVDKLLERKLQQVELAKKQSANLQEVSQALTEKYGEKATEVFKKKAEELGVNESFIRDIVAQSSKAGLELFGLAKKDVATTAAPAGGVNTLALKATQPAATIKPVMGGANTKALLESWRAANPLNQQ